MKTYYYLIAIVVFSFIVRFINISHIPSSPTLDEVTIGYNAYSILQTGMDEYGEKYPILLRAYDDYRPAFYVYLTMPFVATLGLHVMSVRLPSVILGTLSVLFLYLFAKELLTIGLMNKDERLKKKLSFIIYPSFFIENVALLSACLLAVSPWHIYLSRLGHEVNAVLTFTIMGLYFFVYAVHHNMKRLSLVLSAVFFGLTFYTYQSAKITTPLIILLLIIVFWKNILRAKKNTFIAFMSGIIVVIPMIMVSLTPTAWIRFSGTNVLSNNPLFYEDAKRLLEAKEEGDIGKQIYFNRRFTALRIIVKGYMDHFSLPWLFGFQKSAMHKIPYVGLLYPWEFVTIVLGLWIILKNRKEPYAMVILGILIISPIPAALTTQTPHAMRVITWLCVLPIISAIGCIQIYSLKNRKTLRILMFSVCALSIITAFYQYFVVYPISESSSYQYGVKEAILYTQGQEKNVNEVVVGNANILSQSYMFYLYFSTYDPTQYLHDGGTISGGFRESHQIGKWVFRPIEWVNDKTLERRLFIGSPSDFSGDIIPEKVIYDKTNTPVIVIVRTL